MHPPFSSDLEKTFLSHAPGYWADRGVSPEDWNSHIWQLKNRITTLSQLEEHLVLSEEERNGVILTGTNAQYFSHIYNLSYR